ncbi:MULTISPECIES: amino acid-binding protein [unclassified Desulfurobacterium]|uniref:amino acid-binding protein n=1 Tax=Desulfurobacterium sp. TC5-1 TaxID=1158318 RepID=UPI0003B39755|nr:amino acid-binding protein [Desulfurobacterium sp. TC5-1]
MKGKYAVKQISIFLENRKGRLSDVAKTLSLADINIRALFLADSSEFGILRLVVNNPEKAKAVLLADNFAATETEVFAVEVEDKPGGFYNVVKVLAENDIDVEYTYAYAGSSSKAILFFKVKDALFEKAVKVLEESGAKLLEAASVYK